MKKKNKLKLVFVTIFCVTFLVFLLFDENFHEYRAIRKYQPLNESK